MDIENIRKRLEAERAALKSLSSASSDARKAVELDQQSVGRLSRMDAMQAQAMAQRTEQRRQVQIRRIEAALERIANDDFGYCVTCGGDIEEVRLQADPTATLCAGCMRGGTDT